MNEYQWERRTGALKECWDLRYYYKEVLWGLDSSVVGSIRKQKNAHRCRKWIVAVRSSTGGTFHHVCVLNDMKRPDALEAAKMILLSLKEKDST